MCKKEKNIMIKMYDYIDFEMIFIYYGFVGVCVMIYMQIFDLDKFCLFIIFIN